MNLVPIGRVVSERQGYQWTGWRSFRSKIQILQEYAEGLRGIEKISHIIVIYAMDNNDKVNLTVTPQCKPTSPKVGIFASRCPWRPSPIGLTTCRLRSVEKNMLRVEGLDTIDGTIVFDIKPYWPHYDGVEACRYPDWVDYLEF